MVADLLTKALCFPAFIGSPGMNLLRGTIQGTRVVVGGEAIPLGAAYPGLKPGSAVTLGIRPDYATVSGATGLPVQVRRVDDLGRKRLAHLTLGDQPLVATIPPGVELGTDARVFLDPRRIHLYVDDRRVAGESLERAA